MNVLKSLFRRSKKQPQPLRIEGIPQAPLTPEADDAEQAAAALLELMVQGSRFKVQGSGNPADNKATATPETGTPKESRAKSEDEAANLRPETRGAKYYQALARRIREAQEAARLRATRFVAFVEQELAKSNIPTYGPGSLHLLEVELYKRIDTIEREGGTLKRRWQHCLAEVTVRLMQQAEAVQEVQGDQAVQAVQQPTANSQKPIS